MKDFPRSQGNIAIPNHVISFLRYLYHKYCFLYYVLKIMGIFEKTELVGI